MVTVRYENPQSNFITHPFEVGMRHLKVAFCDGSQNTLTQMAKERIIYRASSWNDNEYKALTWKDRSYHAIVGLSETLGYATLVIPFVAASADRFFNKPFYPKGGEALRMHMEEGGNFDQFDTENFRSNPFYGNGTADPFYRGASWLPADNTPSTGSLIGFLIAQAQNYAEDINDPELHEYITDIINKPDFQKDPQAYMENWKLERGRTKEIRRPEDFARYFFESALLQYS